MAKYVITGIWKGADKVITHYALHTVNANGTVERAEKVTKSRAITLLETVGNSASTWTWNYKKCGWDTGEPVQVVGSGNNKYLRSNPDNSLTDNLGHLINYLWIIV